MKQRRPYLLILLLTAQLLLATSSQAEVDNPLDYGITLTKLGDFRKAIPFLRKAVEAAPENYGANYYLGMALNRTAGDKEGESYLKKALMAEPQDPAVNFELGTYYFNKNIYPEAGDYFSQVVQVSPGSELAIKSAAYIDKMNEKPPVKPWEISIFAGGQYDSNVMLNGNGMPLPQGYSGKSDWSTVVNLKGSYAPVKNEAAELTTGYSFYQNLHASLKDFDITLHQLDLTGTVAISNNARLKGVYTFEYLSLNGSEYDVANSLASSLILNGNLGTTTIDYRFRNTSYNNSEQFPTNSDRDGNNHLFGLTHMMPLAGSAALWGLYTHDIELTRVSQWDYDGDHLLAGFRTALPFGIVADIATDIYWKQYRGNDPLYGTTRHDTQYSLSVSLIRNIATHYSISLSEVASRNNSNIPEFEYDRSITSLLLNAKF